MRHAETVTFGGSGLDRAAALRSMPDLMDRARREGTALSILLWRGKPLVQAGSLDQLVRLPMDHPIIKSGRHVDADSEILLGREADGTLVFAHDMSSWLPAGLEATSLNTFLDASEQQHPDLPQDAVFAELRRVMTSLTARDAELAATAKALYSWHASHGFCACCGVASEIAQAGWQRGCPSCNAQHFPRTDPVVIMLILNGNSVLMGRSPGWPDGMYSLLAGFVEPGETIEAAVRREVMEETQVQVGAVRYLASQPWAFPTSLMIGCEGIATSTEITVDPVEIEDAIWVTREDMAQVFAGQHPDIAPARKGAIAHFLLRNWLADTLD
ncbi:NAD(+) diphosphatase [Pseudohalocynthiibacter aestuariivivens]|nr:NAD(+) diphosphatase [Pseudohalocynthiibacter aestuariivivens]QIE46855.1 NAD(+) diphosphatase [Pseudohalocynthiibacter aestuariivivens]